MITKTNLWTQNLADVNEHFNPWFDLQIITFYHSKLVEFTIDFELLAHLPEHRLEIFLIVTCCNVFLSCLYF